MNRVRLAVLGIFAVLAITAITASTASAAATLLPAVPGTKLTVLSSTATLETVTGEKIICKSSNGPGEVEVKSTILVLVTFSGCTVSGFAVNSLGDNSGTILSHLEITFCDINAAKKEAGLSILTLPVHLEVPTLGVLIGVTGSFIAAIETGNDALKHSVTIAQLKGLQAILKCEGAGTVLLLSSKNEGTAVQAGEEATEGDVVSAVLNEIMA